MICRARQLASAHPTACSNCVPVGDEDEGIFSDLWPQCEGICRPCELGSASAPTAAHNISWSGMSRIVGGSPQVVDYLNFDRIPANASHGSCPDGQLFGRQAEARLPRPEPDLVGERFTRGHFARAV